MTHNCNDSDAKDMDKLVCQLEEVAMQNIRRYRAMGSLFRQQAAYHPDQSWKFLAKALHWEHLAELEMSSHFEAYNTETTDSSRSLSVAAACNPFASLIQVSNVNEADARRSSDRTVRSARPG